MSIYTIGDLHLSLGVSKPMDIFEGWENHVEKLTANWKNKVSDTDCVIIPGDVSWAMDFDELRNDFAYIDSLPGKKILLKGNHDFWWSSRSKVERFISENGWNTISLIQNDAVKVEDKVICGTRSWMYSESFAAEDKKVFNRELIRLKMSLDAAKTLGGGEILCFLHYPPIYSNFKAEQIIDLLVEYGVGRCYYGHVHGQSISYSYTGKYRGVDFCLVSADALKFSPLKID